jgi:RNA polymerase sigma factor (sigma-70 family)
MSHQVGDEEKFEGIYADSFDRVAAYVLGRVDRDAAADVIARTFEVAWRRRADIPADPVPWLLGVARRVLSDGRRSARRHDALLERISRTSPTSAEDHLAVLARRDSAIKALARLTPGQREALLLIAWDGLSEREAARVLGCSRGAIALRVHRARRVLRQLSEESDERQFAHSNSSETPVAEPARPIPTKEPI